MRAKRVTLELVAPPSLPGVAADRDKLRQVLTNLVANAVKYSPRRRSNRGRDEGSRRTARHRRSRPGTRDRDRRSRDLIFEKFYRADANMIRGVSGSGLGLYISRELVQRMGGTISVDSTPGEGSTFVVTLPLAAGHSGAT